MKDAAPPQPIDLARETDFEIGCLRAVPSLRQVEAAGAISETLEPRVMQVLVALARGRGRVISHDELIATCWDGRAVGDDAIHRCISRIRKLGDAHQAFFVETIPRVGYRMTAGEPAAPLQQKSAETGDPSSIAVLPFINRSGLPEDDVFADGMTEDLVHALSHYPHWRVLASIVTAGLRKAADADMLAVGRHLAVTYLLDGNVRRMGANLRVAGQLVEVATGAVIWSGRFDRPLSELAALQEHLVTDLAGSLGMEIHILDMQRALKKPGDLTAWEAVTRAMAALRQSDPQSLMRASEEAQKAVAIAPDYAIGHSILASTSALVYFMFGMDDPGEVQRIRTLAERALALGQDNSFALTNASGALALVGFPEEAVAPLNRARNKTPGLGPAWYVSGSAYCLLGRVEEALGFLDQADRLMPIPYMTAYIKEWRGVAMMQAGRWAEAEQLADEALAIAPMLFTQRITKAVICWLTQRREEAHALFAPIRQSGLFRPEQLLTLYRRIYANSPVLNDVLAALNALLAETGEGSNGPRLSS